MELALGRQAEYGYRLRLPCVALGRHAACRNKRSEEETDCVKRKNSAHYRIDWRHQPLERDA